LGVGGWGVGDAPQPPTPQSPIPNPQSPKFKVADLRFLKKYKFIFYLK